MGLEALEHIGQTLAGAGDSPRQTMLFSPRDGDSVRQWRDMTNVRYRHDGYREDIFLRGGTELVSNLGGGDIIQSESFSVKIDGQTTDYIVVKRDDGVVLYNLSDDETTGVFSGLFSGSGKVWFELIGRFLFVFDPANQQYRYLDLKTMGEHKWCDYDPAHIDALSWIESGDFTDGNVWGFQKEAAVICLDQTFESETVSLSGLESLDHGSRAVYKYTYNGGKYITLDGVEYKTNALFRLPGVTGISYDGAGAEAELVVYFIHAIQNEQIDFSPHRGTIYAIGEGQGSEGQAATVDLTVQNTVDEDGDLIIERQDNPNLGEASGEITTVPLTTSMTEADIVEAIVTAINANSEDMFLEAEQFPSVARLTETREGEFANDTLLIAHFDPSSMEDSGSPIFPDGPGIYSFVMDGGVDGTPGAGDANTISVNQQYDVPVNRLVHQDETLILPDSLDIRPLTQTGGKFTETDMDVTEADNFNIPSVHRGYLLVWELNDGSFTIPGRPESISVDANAILDGYEFTRRGVQIDRESGDPPSNAVKLHLFATRWQLDVQDCYRPSERYPNGAFYHASEHEPDTVQINDFTADKDLLDNLNAYVPKSGGIINMFGPGQIAPETLMRSGDLLLLGGYGIHRAASFDRHISVDASGSTTANVRVGAVYEYTDKTRSDLFLHDTDAQGENVIRIHGANLLLSAIHLYLVDTSQDDHFHVRTVRPPQPEFFGLKFTVSGATGDYDAVSDPAGDDDDHKVDLGGYVAVASPPQTIRIDSQFPIRGVGTIRRMIDVGLDADRDAIVRRRFVALTDRAPVSGLVSAVATEQGVRYAIDSEQANLVTPIRSRFAAESMGENVFFQSSGGIYTMSGRDVRLIASSDRYPMLSEDILDMAFHERHGELWVLGPDNQGLSIPFRDDLQAAPRISLITWPTTNARSAASLDVVGDNLYAGFDGRIYQTDKNGVLSDAIHTSGSAPTVSGDLTSDHLSAWDVQLYLNFIELYGQGYEGRILVDLQAGRFDQGDSWSRDFSAGITAIMEALSMRGGEVPLQARGIAPRLRVELEAAGEGRFSGLSLTYEPISDNGINRR